MTQQVTILTTCRRGGRLLMANTIVELDDADAEQLMELEFARPVADDDAPEPEPEPEPVDPVVQAQTERMAWRVSASWENRTTALETLVDELLRRVAELEGR